MGNIALYIAVLLYTALSSPTPDIMAWPEYGVGFLLILSIGFSGFIFSITERNMDFTPSYHRIYVLLMLCIPSVIGVIHGYDVQNIIRDVIPIAFLILPLCFYNVRLDALGDVLAFGGGLFALRYLAPMLPYFDFMPHEASLLYLANSPLVPFAAIYGFHLFSETGQTYLSKRLVGIVISILCFAAMAAMLQRAPLILCATSCLGILGLRTFHKPIQSMIIGAIIMACLIPFMPLIMDVIQNIGDKTLHVGLNNRTEEFQAILDKTTLFGLGWGAEWQSPAVADIWVRFTHNIFSYFWLKTGAIGAIATIIFISLWGFKNITLIKQNMAIGIAIFIPFLIHVTLYSGFKTLDFALLLTLIMTSCRERQNQ